MTAKKRVLVVEDDERLAQAIVATLQGCSDLETIVTTTAAAASAAQHDFPAALVLDIDLAEDGWRVLEAVQECGRVTLPVIVVGADSIPRSVLREWGVFRFLPKPFSMAELLEAVTRGVKLTEGDNWSRPGCH